MTNKSNVSRLAGCSLVVAAFLCMNVASSAQYDLDKQINEHRANARQYMGSKESDKAIVELKAILDLDPADFEAHGNLGFLYYFQQDCTSAVAELRSATEIQPAMWRELALLGICEDRLGEQDKAAIDLEAAFPHIEDPKLNRDAGLTLLHLYTGNSDLPKAAAVLAVLTEKNPNDPQLNYSAYQLYSALAGEAVIHLTVDNSDSPEMHRVMAHEAMRYGDRVQAVTQMHEAIKLNPRMPGLHVELANMLNSARDGGDRAEAEKEYKLALEQDPRDEIALYRLGEIAAKRGETAAALAYYLKAIQIAPNEPQANIGLAKVYLAMQQPEKAALLLENVIKQDPSDDIAHYRLSAVYRQLGRTAEMTQQLAEYQKYKALKDKKRMVYSLMKLHKDEPDENEADADKK